MSLMFRTGVIEYNEAKIQLVQGLSTVVSFTASSCLRRCSRANSLTPCARSSLICLVSLRALQKVNAFLSTRSYRRHIQG